MEKNSSKPQRGNRQSGVDNSMIKQDHEYYQQDSESTSKKTASKYHRKPTKTEGNATPGEKIPCESSNTLDDSGLSILSQSDVEEDAQLDTCKSQTTKPDSEEDSKYEELVCLVRQFYVEKPINPAALAHQNIETC